MEPLESELQNEASSNEHPAHEAFILHTRLAVGFGRKVALRALSPIHPIIGFPDVFTHILQMVPKVPSATPKEY